MNLIARSALALVLLAPVAGCAGDSSTDEGEDITIDVLAASSLTEVFTSLAQDFERSHPGVTVRLSFGSSAALAQQVSEGAPADVLATADLESMARTGDAVEETQEFASNEMVLVTPASNPGDLHSLADLDRPAVTFVTCVESAPCGRVAAQLLKMDGVTSKPVSLEADVKAVMAKVTTDEVDAGFVYITDARSGGDAVRTLRLPSANQVPARYAIGKVSETDHDDLAEDWLALVEGDSGQAALTTAGFGRPESS